MTTIKYPLIAIIAFTCAYGAEGEPGALGLFSGHADIGSCAKAGAVAFSPASGEYRITGGGANMWANIDAFHFLWKQMSGDFVLTADVRILGTGGNAHRKACLLVRQSLAPDSAYADVALHGDGMAALQWRDAAGERTYTIHSEIPASPRLRL
jgi:TolB protein